MFLGGLKCKRIKAEVNAFFRAPIVEGGIPIGAVLVYDGKLSVVGIISVPKLEVRFAMVKQIV